MRLTDFDTEDSPKLPQNFINNMKHTSDFDDMSVPYFDRLAVLVMEGIATDEERAEYAKLLKDNDKNQLSASIYSKCRLEPDSSIRMPNAQSLKRQPRILPLFWKISSAVAVLALGWFGLARQSAMQNPPAIHGIAESTVQPAPREVLCLSAETQEIAEPVSVAPNKSSIVSADKQSFVSADQQNIVSADQQETLVVHAETEPMAMPEMPTRIPCPLAENEKMTPMYEQEPADGPKSAVVAYFADKINDIKELVAYRNRTVRSKSARIIDGIQPPVEVVRNDQGEVREVVITAFNKTFTYRRPL